MAKAGKGSKFERKICKQLSTWWTENERDDIFWRTSQSGGRATQRKKTGQGTANQYGDVQATDPIGQPLISLCAIEIKKGYKYHTFFDLIDKLPSETKQPYLAFIRQAISQQKAAKSFSYLLISSRDRKEPIITMPYKLYRLIRKEHLIPSNGISNCFPQIIMQFDLPESDFKQKVFITTLEQFFKNVNSKTIKKLWKKIKKTNELPEFSL